jgi:hypothetical protein
MTPSVSWDPFSTCFPCRLPRAKGAFASGPHSILSSIGQVLLTATFGRFKVIAHGSA